MIYLNQMENRGINLIKAKIYILVFAISFLLDGNPAKADDFSFSYSGGTHLLIVGGSPSQGNNLNETVTKGFKVEATYFSGIDNGFLVGLGQGYDVAEYEKKIATNAYSIYNSDHKYFFLRSGYWFRTTSSLLIEFSVIYGQGKFSFSGYNTDPVEFDPTSVYGIEGKLRYPIPLHIFENVDVDVLFGLGYSQAQVKDFTYYGNKFSSDEFKGTLLRSNILYGVGIRF